MPKAYALLSTYPPTRCGLATFSAALFAHLREPGDQAVIVRVLEILSGGAGLLVERQNPAAARALHRVFTETGLSARMSRHAADLATALSRSRAGAVA